MFSCSSSSPFSDNMDNYNSDRTSSNIWGGNGNGNGISNSNQDDNKFGFEIPKFKSFAPSSLPFSSSNPLSPSPFLASTPPAFSPSIFLDSPAFFSSSNILPSPTTGSFAAQNNQSQQDTKREQNNFIDFSFHPNPRPPPTTSMAITLQSSSNNFSMEQQNWTLSKPMKQPDFAPVKIQPSHVPIPSNQHNGEIRKLDDGYNWRKYGQKQVKGSENPRSYYKCTFPNCPTKKKVERSLDGQITEIVYKGSHNHPKPQSTRRSSSAHSMVNSEISDHSVNDTTDCLMLQEDNTSGSTGGDVFEQGSPLSNLDDDNETEPDAKRWKGESENEGYVGSGSRTVREPRIVVQTTSDIDILDDGYRWRKYGQKVVKGNPNPRSYYKCTTIGCPVRKHVERASQDMRAVITAYEGKHNHDVPAARGSGYAMNRLSSNPSTTTTATMPIRPSAVSSNSANFPYSLGPSGPAALGRLEMQRGDGGFGIMNQAQPMYGAFPRAKEESKDDSFFDSFLS